MALEWGWAKYVLPYIVSVVIALWVWHIGNSQHQDLCKVVRDVHTNAVFRWHTEQDNYHQTLDYLNDPGTPHDALWRRVKANLPTTHARLDDAKRGAEATEVPGSCTS